MNRFLWRKQSNLRKETSVAKIALFPSSNSGALSPLHPFPQPFFCFLGYWFVRESAVVTELTAILAKVVKMTRDFFFGRAWGVADLLVSIEVR